MRDSEPFDGVILQYIYDYCRYVEELLDEYGREEAIFRSRRSFRDSVSMNVLCIGEYAGRLSEAFRKATGDRIPWQAIRAMRNRFAHNYMGMDVKMIWDTALREVPKLKAFCEEQLPLIQTGGDAAPEDDTSIEL